MIAGRHPREGWAALVAYGLQKNGYTLEFYSDIYCNDKIAYTTEDGECKLMPINVSWIIKLTQSRLKLYILTFYVAQSPGF